MEAHFLSSYVELLIQTCHRRGIHAMGGMAAQIPIRNDAAANEQAIEKVRRDKLREVKAGHDGTWVAHPGLVPVAKEFSTSTCRKRIRSRNRERPRGASEGSDRGSEGRDHRGRSALEHRRRPAVPAFMAAGIGLRSDLQPDGRCGDCGDLPRPGVAMGAARRAPQRRQAGDGRDGQGIIHQRTAELGKGAGRSAGSDEKLQQAAKVLESLATGKDFADFLTLASYDLLD